MAHVAHSDSSSTSSARNLMDIGKMVLWIVSAVGIFLTLAHFGIIKGKLVVILTLIICVIVYAAFNLLAILSFYYVAKGIFYIYEESQRFYELIKTKYAKYMQGRGAP